MSESALLRSKSHAKGVQEGKRVETANSLSARDFFLKYYHPGPRDVLYKACERHWPQLKPLFRDASALKELGLFDGCLNLIESTSGADYNNSELKWSAARKRKEMLLPDMKYIILLDTEAYAPDDPKALPVAGFISFMITYEDSHEVTYVYEVHLVKEWRGFKFGRQLMAAVEEISQQVGVTKVMLTVFKANEDAFQFYQRIGYVEDEFSPGPRELRNGLVKESTYTILSKQL